MDAGVSQTAPAAPSAKTAPAPPQTAWCVTISASSAR